MEKRKTTVKKFFNALFQLAAVFVFFIALFSLIKWLMEKTPAAPPAAEQTIGENPPPSTVVPRPSASTALKASFTELFSGTGWKNESKSTAYQDLKTTVISLPPSYNIEEIPSFSAGLKNETVIAAKGNGNEVVLVAQDGKIFEFQNGAASINQSSVIPARRSLGEGGSHQLSGAALDYDDSSGVWVVAASAPDGIFIGPIGQISPISPVSPIGLITDLSCSGGECLLLSGADIYRFAESNPSALIRVSLPDIIRVNPLLSIGKAKNILLVGVVHEDGSTSLTTGGSAYNGDIFEYSGGSLHPVISNQSSVINNQPLFISDYPGTIRFGYDSADDKILAVYAAYIGQAKLLKLSVISNQLSVTADYSRFFPQRVMEGISSGDVRFSPEIFYKNGAWWLSSSAGDQVQKIARIEGGVLIDLEDKISLSLSLLGTPLISSIFIAPGFGDRQIYVFAVGQGSTKVFQLADLGFETSGSVAWESSNLNQWNRELVSGSIFRVDAGDGNSITNDQSSMIKYYLSADGGQTWTPAKLGETVYFKKGVFTGNAGNDFRYRIEISPGISQFQSPWVDTIGVEYSVVPE